jgi:hypothetical protein
MRWFSFLQLGHDGGNPPCMPSLLHHRLIRWVLAVVFNGRAGLFAEHVRSESGNHWTLNFSRQTNRNGRHGRTLFT